MDNTVSAEDKKGKKHIVVKHSQQTIETYEVDAPDVDEDLVDKIVGMRYSTDWLRFMLGCSLAGNLFFSVLLLTMRFQLPYSEAIQVVDAISSLVVFLGGVFWSQKSGIA